MSDSTDEKQVTDAEKGQLITASWFGKPVGNPTPTPVTLTYSFADTQIPYWQNFEFPFHGVRKTPFMR